MLLDGQPRGAVAARAAAEGLDAAVFVPADLEPEKLTAAAAYGPTVYAVDGHYDHCSRLTVELSFELPWGFVRVSTSARTTERARRRSPTRSPSSSAGRCRTSSWPPIASGALFHKVGQGFAELRTLGLVDGVAPSLVGGQAEGCQPVATAFRERTPVKPVRPDTIARSLAIGSPADGDFAVATARETGGADPCRGRGRRWARTWPFLARTTGVFGETATGVTLGALRSAVAAGDVRSRDRVVLLVTGDGLKTPGPVSFTYAPVAIEADADAFLYRVQAAA